MIYSAHFRRLALYLGLVLTGLAILPAAENTAARPYTFKRGVNISHWLSQNNAKLYYAAPWFDEEDITWIAAQGFDHIRYPIDGRQWLRPDGSLDEAKIEPFVRALAWTKAHGLGAILDMHFLPGASFDQGDPQDAVFTDMELQGKVADFWARVAKRFAGEGDYLRFELLNEPVAAKNADLNGFTRRMLAAIRESNPTRIVYITSNRWSSFPTVGDIEVPADAHIAITLHFYEPMIFTHQRAPWVKFPADMPAIKFPGPLPDLAPYLPANNYALKPAGYELTVQQIDDAFAKVAAWAAQHAPGIEIHIGEFGVYLPADAISKQHWISAVKGNAERRGWGWAVWDYQDSFGVRDAKGEGTPILEGLFPKDG